MGKIKDWMNSPTREPAKRWEILYVMIVSFVIGVTAVVFILIF